MSENNRVQFTKKMRRDYTILVPNMLPIQLTLLTSIMNNYGYHIEVLDTMGDEIVQQGLKNVHNDTCYPALLVIGQLMDALESGKYNTKKVALMLPQTGGGCRASNYIHLLRKALEKNGYDYIPVISLNFAGLEDNPGFEVKPTMLLQVVYGVLLGDLIMLIHNQCRAYEVHRGDSQKVVDALIHQIVNAFKPGKVIPYRQVKQLYDVVLEKFAQVKLDRSVKKKRVGIVGEIYVKFAPLGNNNLEEFLLSENTEPVLAGLMDFALYCMYNSVIDHELYGRSAKAAMVGKALYQFTLSKQKDIIRVIRKQGLFQAPSYFDDVRKSSQKIIGSGVKMGEGWLLPAEMVELIEEGVLNIVCAQPFGCLPNHIVGKGMVRKIKETYPEANIVSIDYDPGASKINQENRIKLMLSSAK